MESKGRFEPLFAYVAKWKEKPNMLKLRATLMCTTLCLPGLVYGTPPFGFSSQTFRGRIAENVGAHQWNPNPLFTFLIQSSSDQWGYDVVQGTTEFAPMDAMGRPSQSGWHDHPTALSVALVIQGTVWSHDAHDLSCLRPIPTGSVFFERSGQIHNNYNLDPRTPAIVRIIHFVNRNLAATRRDQPDPVTGGATASPAPPPCPAETPRANSSPEVPANGVRLNSFRPMERENFSPPVLARRRDDGAE
jgi:hypothetical protein